MNNLVSKNERELSNWRTRIETAWQKSVASVIEVGRLVKQAKEELGVSFTLLETELPFSSSVAAFLIKIAENPVLSNPVYQSRLPNSYNTLYHLAGVDSKQLVKQIENGEITPNYTLASAKSLKVVSPKPLKKATGTKQKTTPTTYEVGIMSIPAPKNIDQFEKDLGQLLAKYEGTIALTHKEQSLAEWHRKQLHQYALKEIDRSESSLKGVITLEDLRILEDAAHYLSKPKNPKKEFEIVIKDELVTRKGLPDDYKDIKRLRKLLEIENITRGQLQKWCIDNKVPNQFTDMTKMDKDLYIWEKVRLITEKKDVNDSLKRLNSLATRSTIPKIKSTAQKALAEVTRFDRKV